MATCGGVARRLLAGDAQKIHFTPTELAHEAAIRLILSQNLSPQDSGHLLAIAARTMRRVLIDEARKTYAARRRAPTLVTILPSFAAPVPLDELDAALDELSRASPEHAQIVELRFLARADCHRSGGRDRYSQRTVKRRWQAARLWLTDYLKRGMTTLL